MIYILDSLNVVAGTTVGSRGHADPPGYMGVYAELSKVLEDSCCKFLEVLASLRVFVIFVFHIPIGAPP